MDSLWKIMRETNFESCEPIAKEMMCIICKNILINAHSGPCGCLYCFDCISTQISHQILFCPGNNEDCQRKILNINTDVVVDRSTNIAISKLFVKCPVINCVFKDELKKIENHMRICSMRCEKCPFFDVGCKEYEICTDKLSSHLVDDIVTHSKLLLESIDNLRNEVESLKKDVEKLRVEKNLLVDEIDLLKINNIEKEAIVELREKNNNENLEKFNKINENIKILNRTIVLDKDKNPNKIEPKQKSFDEDLNQSINRFKENSESEESINDELLNSNAEECEHNMDLTSDSVDINKFSRAVDINIKNLQMQIFKIESNTEKQNYGDFLWIIDNWAERLKQAESGMKSNVFSEAFYTHKFGYKLCLRIYPIGIGDGKGTHLSLFFHVMRGEYDNILLWPCKFNATFQIYNQNTGLVHLIQSTKYENKPYSSAYKKPNNQRNVGIGVPKFIEIKESSNLQLNKNNQIFIRCTINLNI